MEVRVVQTRRLHWNRYESRQWQICRAWTPLICSFWGGQGGRFGSVVDLKTLHYYYVASQKARAFHRDRYHLPGAVGNSTQQGHNSSDAMSTVISTRSWILNHIWRKFAARKSFESHCTEADLKASLQSYQDRDSRSQERSQDDSLAI